VEKEPNRIRKVFHITGVPKVPRNARVDLLFSGPDLVVEKGKKTAVSVPLARIRQALLLSGERHYPGATYGAAVATFGVGSLLILRKRKVDMLILEYANERGGLVGMVFQMPSVDGARSKALLEGAGVGVEEPAAAAPPGPPK